MERTMKRYGVNHHFSTSYHPQTNGQVENMNRALKRILEKTVKDNPAIWLRKLDDALWAFRTAYKPPTGTTPYKLIYGKNCHLSFKIKHQAYWALKNCNPDLIAADDTISITAWTSKGISTLASRVGKYLVMDHVTLLLFVMVVWEGLDSLQPLRKKNDKSSNVPQNKLEIMKRNKTKEQRIGRKYHLKSISVHGEILSAMKRSANKYSVLEVYDEQEIIELNEIKNREIVDNFISQKKIPSDNEMLS
ncbi:reverse transcriptase domain-containing protein [Tanacetum coccineum]